MIRRTRLSTEIFKEIRRMIAEEKYKPGQKFYSEHQLVEKLSASRPSIREALKMLEGLGEVHIVHGKGVFIGSEWLPKNEEVGEYIRSHREQLHDHFEVRLLVEPVAASYAAKRRSSNDLEEMRASLLLFESAVEKDDTKTAVEADGRFHAAIARATRNRTLSHLMSTMVSSLSEGWMTSLATPGRSIASINEHRAILSAIEESDDKRASDSMECHLRNAVKSIDDVAKSSSSENNFTCE